VAGPGSDLMLPSPSRPADDVVHTENEADRSSQKAPDFVCGSTGSGSAHQRAGIQWRPSRTGRHAPGSPGWSTAARTSRSGLGALPRQRVPCSRRKTPQSSSAARRPSSAPPPERLQVSRPGRTRPLGRAGAPGVRIPRPPPCDVSGHRKPPDLENRGFGGFFAGRGHATGLLVAAGAEAGLGRDSSGAHRGRCRLSRDLTQLVGQIPAQPG
jgi:hypothetical protein